MHQTGMKTFENFQANKGKHSHGLAQRLGPSPALQEKHDESVCPICLRTNRFV